MTSKAGSYLIAELFADPGTAADAAGLATALWPEWTKHFKPTLLGRVTLLPYFPLSGVVIGSIMVLHLNKIAKWVRAAYHASFDYVPVSIETTASRCTENQSGAGNVDNILSRRCLPELPAEMLSRLAEGTAITRVFVGMNPEGTFCYAVS